MQESIESMLFGRETAKENVLEAVRSANFAANETVACFVRGAAGSGRSVFLKNALHWLTEAIDHPLLIFQADSKSRLSGSQPIADILRDGVTSEDPELVKDIKDCTAKLKRGNKGAHRPILLDYYQYCSLKTPTEAKLPGCLVVIENVDLGSTNTNSLLAAELLEPLMQLEHGFPRIVLFTGSESYDFVIEHHSELDFSWSRFSEIQLEPFTKEIMRAYLQKLELSHADFDELWQASNGNWRKLNDEIRKHYRPQSVHFWNSLAEEVLAAHTEREQLWCLRASLLKDVTPRTMALFYSNSEAEEAVRWLNRNHHLPWENGHGNRCLQEELAQALSRQFAHLYAEKYCTDTAIADAQNEVINDVPLDNDRAVLIDLAMFNHFNHNILNEIFGNEGAYYRKFVEMHPRYFERAGEKQHIVGPLKRKIENFRNAIGHEFPGELTQRLHELWKNERTRLQKEISDTKTEIATDRDRHENISKELEKLSKHIASIEERFKPKEPQQRVRKKQKVKRKGFGDVVLQVSGIALFYVAIIVNRRYSVGYAVLGILLISIGFFNSWMSQKERVKETVPAGNAPLPEKDIQRDLSTADRLYYLRKADLERRRKHFEKRLALRKKRFVELKSLLDTPYCADKG